MNVSANARCAVIAFAAVAALVAVSIRPVAAQGGLIHLVAHGAQDVYLTAGATASGEEAAVNTANVSRDIVIDPSGATIVDPAHDIVIEP
jgi:hypothetical protein